MTSEAAVRAILERIEKNSVSTEDVRGIVKDSLHPLSVTIQRTEIKVDELRDRAESNKLEVLANRSLDKIETNQMLFDLSEDLMSKINSLARRIEPQTESNTGFRREVIKFIIVVLTAVASSFLITSVAKSSIENSNIAQK